MFKARAEQTYKLPKLLLAVLGSAFLLWPVFDSLNGANIFAASTGYVAQRRRTRSGSNTSVGAKVDSKNFSHSTHITSQKLACSACHTFPTKNWKEVRKGDAAFADVAEFPDHSACLDCHRHQFFARERPAPSICSNCHVNVTPRDSTRFLFPSLGDLVDASRPKRDLGSEFNVNFPHEVHLEAVSADARTLQNPAVKFVRVGLRQDKASQGNCPVCHETYKPQGDSSEEYVTKPPDNPGDAFWLKKGTFKTIPNSHAGCFTCHNADSGIAPTSAECQVCHKLPATTSRLVLDFDPKFISAMGLTDTVIVKTWRKRISAGAYRHEGGAHPDLACTDCHRPSVMNTAVPNTIKVPVRSCGAEGCHITATTDDGGSLNFELDQKKADPTFVCTKCHITFGKESVPLGHLQALPTPTAPKKPVPSGL